MIQFIPVSIIGALLCVIAGIIANAYGVISNDAFYLSMCILIAGLFALKSK